MKNYTVDVERKLYCIKSFFVKADSQEEAETKAIEMAKRSLWTNYADEAKISIMSCTEN